MNSQKRIASQILKSGVSRIRVKQSKEVDEALTRDDIRSLIRKGYIWKEQKKGTSKFNAKRKVKQKKRGRMNSYGSRKGTRGARKPHKDAWIETVRPLRRLLRELRDSEKIEKSNYRKIYLMIKGGSFRSKNHLLYYLKDHEMLKKGKKTVEVPNKVKEKKEKPKTKTKKKPEKKPKKKTKAKAKKG